MINYNTQPHRFIYTFKSLALLTMLVLSLSANAQYTIKVDSLKFPAYYPPTCNNCNVDYNTVWYNDVEIDIVTRTGVVSGTPDCPNNKCPTIILTPGGGFAELLTGGLLNDKAEHNLNDTVTLAVSLAKKRLHCYCS